MSSSFHLITYNNGKRFYSSVFNEYFYNLCPSFVTPIEVCLIRWSRNHFLWYFSHYVVCSPEPATPDLQKIRCWSNRVFKKFCNDSRFSMIHSDSWLTLNHLQRFLAGYFIKTKNSADVHDALSTSLQCFLSGFGLRWMTVSLWLMFTIKETHVSRVSSKGPGSWGVVWHHLWAVSHDKGTLDSSSLRQTHGRYVWDTRTYIWHQIMSHKNHRCYIHINSLLQLMMINGGSKRRWFLKGSFCLHLLACMTLFLQWNTKADVLKFQKTLRRSSEYLHTGLKDMRE